MAMPNMATVGRHGGVGLSPSSRFTCPAFAAASFADGSRLSASRGRGSRSRESGNGGLSSRRAFVSSSTAGRRCLRGPTAMGVTETRSATIAYASIAGRCGAGLMFMSASRDEISMTSTPTAVKGEMCPTTSRNAASCTTSFIATTTSSRQRVGPAPSLTTVSVFVGASIAGRPCRSALKNGSQTKVRRKVVRQVSREEGLRTPFSPAGCQTSTCRSTGPSCSGRGGRRISPIGACRPLTSITVLEGIVFCICGVGVFSRSAISVRRAYGAANSRLPFQTKGRGSAEVVIGRRNGPFTRAMVVFISPLSSVSHAPITT